MRTLLLLCLVVPIFAQPQSQPLPPTKAIGDEASNGKAKESDRSSADWWMVRLTGTIAFISFVQAIVFGLQARRLKQTIEKMDAIAGQQSQDVQASKAEGTRAAQAMERISASMASNVESVRESVGISRDIADTLVSKTAVT